MRASAAVVAAAATLLLLGRVAQASPVSDAVARFEAGEYEQVVTALKPLIVNNQIGDVVERAQALRIYGIACVLTDEKTGAEGAFLLWLRLDPRARLDPSLVRPEVVTFFDDVRARHRDDLVREVERRRPRSAFLNLLPPAGQYQNRQDLKFTVLLMSELVTLGVNVATGATLFITRASDGTYPNSAVAERLQFVNWGSFTTLLVVLVYGVIDGFVYLGKIRRAIDRDEASLRAAGPAPRRSPIAATATGLALRF